MYDPWTRLQPPLDSGSDGGESFDWPPSPGAVRAVVAAAAAPARPVLEPVDANVRVEATADAGSVFCPEKAGGSDPLPPRARPPPASSPLPNEPALATVVDGVLAEAAVVVESVQGAEEEGGNGAPPPPPPRIAALRRELAALRARLALLSPSELGRFLDIKIQLARRAAAGEAAGEAAGGGRPAPSAPVPVPKPKPAPAGARRGGAHSPLARRRPWA